MKDLEQRLDDLLLELEFDPAPSPPKPKDPLRWTWECDSGGNYIYCSPEVEDILGIGPEHFIGKPLSSFRLSPQSSKKLEIILGTQATESKANLEFRSVGGDLLTLSMNISQSITPDGTARNLHGTAQLITKDDQVLEPPIAKPHLDLASDTHPLEEVTSEFQGRTAKYSSSTYTSDWSESEVLVDTQDRLQEIHLSDRLFSLVVESANLKDKLRLLLNDLGQALDIYSGNVLLFNPDYTIQTIVAEYSIHPNLMPAIGTEFPLNWISEIVLKSWPNHIIQDKHTDINTKPIYELMRAQGIQSRAIFPLTFQNVVIGTLSMDLIEAFRKFTPEDIRMVETEIARSLATFNYNDLVD